jgi:hypothetical protein
MVYVKILNVCIKYLPYVQIVCDADLKIINCVAKWPGSVHDVSCASLTSSVHSRAIRNLSPASFSVTAGT